MKYFTDLHIHSRFARATSKALSLPILDVWARKKGLAVIGTGDFTHPQWFAEIFEQLELAEDGFFALKPQFVQQPFQKDANGPPTRFFLSAEISSIYSKNGKVRRVHTLVTLPSLEAAKTFIAQLEKRGANLRSDGRPIVGIDAKDVARMAFDANPHALVVPAHAWTPWFSVFGSMSGFDSLDECFEELTPKIYAIETGLSSSPSMNWRLSALDRVALVSGSDNHSAKKLGREAIELDGEMTYSALYEAIRTGAPVRAGERVQAKARLLGTVEFFPEEGKYHYDGHRLCKVCWTPEERKAHGGRCPVCGRAVTVGVMSRVDDLADRNDGTRPEGAPNFRSLVPLEEIIAEALGVGTGTKRVMEQYERLVSAFGNEFAVLLDTPVEGIADASLSIIGEGVKRVREGELHIDPGYDGEFGTVHVFTDKERERFSNGEPTTQASLF